MHVFGFFGRLVGCALGVGSCLLIGCSPTESTFPTAEINAAVFSSGSAPAELTRVADDSSNQLIPVPDRNGVESPSHPTATGHKRLFVGWPKPRVALMLTGRQHGYLEPCGCAGLDNQKGGLIRRYTLVKQLRAKGWNVVPIDAGNQVRRFGRQPEIKFQITIEGLRMMGYQVIAFGPDDLRLPAPELIAVVTSGDEQTSRFVGANVVLFDPSFTSAYRVIRAGGMKIGVTAVLGARNQKLVDNEDITLISCDKALAEVWPKLKREACDTNILIVHGSIDESKLLARKFPGFSWVITTGGAGEPKIQPARIEGTNARLVEVGTKGMYAGVIGFFDDAKQPVRYQRIPLDDRFADSPTMLRLLAAYQDQLKDVGLDGLGIRPQPHPSGQAFAGSEACSDCHPRAYEIWKDGLKGKGGPHGHAFQTLMQPPKRAKVARHFDPECISCHVIGWNPQKGYPYLSGYLDLERTPNMINVGCENCHGPGAAHVRAENGDDDLSDKMIEKLQKEMKLPLEKAERKCLECHDLDNSPEFQEKGAFERYWKKIKH